MRIQTELERRLEVRLLAARFWAFGFGASVQMKQAAQQFQSGQQVRVARNAGVTAQTTNDPFGGLEVFVRPCEPSGLQFGLVTGNEVARLAIMRAELSRRNGDTAAALEYLRALPANSLTAREELSLFPALRELTEDIRLPPALEVQARTLVQVQALGVLSVSVNARAVPIQPTSRVGELLVLLLECNAHAAIDALLDALWPHMPPGKPERDRKRKSLWWLVKELRHLLG